jgi:hypothetical protein
MVAARSCPFAVWWSYPPRFCPKNPDRHAPRTPHPKNRVFRGASSDRHPTRPPRLAVWILRPKTPLPGSTCCFAGEEGRGQTQAGGGRLIGRRTEDRRRGRRLTLCGYQRGVAVAGRAWVPKRGSLRLGSPSAHADRKEPRVKPCPRPGRRDAENAKEAVVERVSQEVAGSLSTRRSCRRHSLALGVARAAPELLAGVLAASGRAQDHRLSASRAGGNSIRRIGLIRRIRLILPSFPFLQPQGRQPFAVTSALHELLLDGGKGSQTRKDAFGSPICWSRRKFAWLIKQMSALARTAGSVCSSHRA